MRFTLFLIISSALVLTASCKKDKLITYSNTLQIGGSSVTTTDFSPTTFQELDVDNDGLIDFTFEVQITTGGSTSMIYDIQMISAHSGASVLYHIPNDTIFTGTVVEISGVSPNIVHSTYNYSGPENLAGTSLYSVSTIKVANYQSDNDVIQSAGLFTSEAVHLDHHRITQNYNNTGVSGDTTFYSGFYLEELGDYYGLDPYRYVAFKMSDGNGVNRLGWLKLKITNHYQLEIFQMGLQDPI